MDIRMTLWRDHDPRVNQLPGMSLGTETACLTLSDVARDLYDRGVRRVELPAPVRLTGRADTPGGAGQGDTLGGADQGDTLGGADQGDNVTTVRELVLIRELTSHGVAVSWELTLDADAAGWPLLSHLYPPAIVRTDIPGQDIAGDWRTSFYFGRCLYRHGPGFVQVRDRRFGRLRRITIDEQSYRDAIEVLREGVPASDIPDDVRRAFIGANLVGAVGDRLWWLPCRAGRWPPNTFL